jgi:hypothetical protein
VLNKDGQAIVGMSPASGYAATAADVTAGIITFSNIPAGSGYKVSVSNNSCPSAIEPCRPRPVGGISAMVQTTSVPIELIGAASKVSAAPNPYNDRIRFTVQSNVSGRGSLELYNMLGQRVKTIFEGEVQKGQVKTIEYAVPGAQRSGLIYMFRVGNERTSGKLIGLN